MGTLGDLLGLAVFGDDIRPNQRSKNPVWSILLKLTYYSVALGVLLFFIAPMVFRS